MPYNPLNEPPSICKHCAALGNSGENNAVLLGLKSPCAIGGQGLNEVEIRLRPFMSLNVLGFWLKPAF